MSNLWERILAVFFPERCLFCETVIEYASLVCPSCREKYRPCTQAEIGMPPVDGILGVYPYEEEVKTAVWDLKFHKRKEKAVSMGRLMAFAAKEVLDHWEVQVVTFVPLHPRDRQERGYNQAELLAVSLANQMKLPVEPLLRKTRRTKKQHELSALEREENLQDVYDIILGKQLQGKHVLLVDDVVTTGSTTKECAKVLKSYGAKRVFVLSFSKT